MRPHRIDIIPVQGGWYVTSALCGLPLMFLSGACAEAQARRLGAAVQAVGGTAEIRIHDRSGGLAAHFALPAHHEPEPVSRRHAVVARAADPRAICRTGLDLAQGDRAPARVYSPGRQIAAAPMIEDYL